jgi:hypothetical protein
MSANLKTHTLDRLAYRLRLAIRSSVQRNHTRKNHHILHHNLHILKSNQLNLAILRSKTRIFHKGEISVIWAKKERMREVASTGT